MAKWISIATRRDIVRRGLKIGLIVGTILTAINHGDVILAGQMMPDTGWKILLSYLVPYCVSTYAGVLAILADKKDA
jgi:Mg/Co/Ni transporter MgtE